MANLTAKEKALNVLAKHIKELDKKTLVLDVLDSRDDINKSRKNLFNIIERNGFELTKDYKLVLKK